MAFAKLLIVVGLVIQVPRRWRRVIELIKTSRNTMSNDSGYAFRQNDWPRGPMAPTFLPIRMPFAPFPPFPPFPPFQTFTPPMIPFLSHTPADIAAFQPGPNQVFQGASVQSTIEMTRDDNGNIFSNGGSTMTTNNNGVVNTVKVGNAPPDINRVITIPPMPDFDFPEMPEFEFPEIPEIDFPEIPKLKPFKIKPISIDPEDIQTHVPKKNEKFFGSHTSFFDKFSNINGVKSSSGHSRVLVNDNGKVDDDFTKYQQGDKPDQDTEKKTKDNEDFFNFKPHKFKMHKPIVIKHKLDKEELKHHVPKKNEHYVSFSSSRSEETSNINGVKHASGQSETMLNNNGKVEIDKTKYSAGDKPKSKGKDIVTVEDEE